MYHVIYLAYFGRFLDSTKLCMPHGMKKGQFWVTKKGIELLMV